MTLAAFAAMFALLRSAPTNERPPRITKLAMKSSRSRCSVSESASCAPEKAPITEPAVTDAAIRSGVAPDWMCVSAEHSTDGACAQ